MNPRDAIALLLMLFSTAGLNGAPVVTRWEPVGLSGGGAMFSPAISPADPDLMMLNCDMGAAYISRDGGRNWRMIHQAQLRSDIGCRPAFHPADAKIIFASSGGRLRKSIDGGETFASIGNLNEALQGEICINPLNPAMIIAGTRAGRCFLSADGGERWSRCEGPSGKVIGFHFDRTREGRTIFAATDKGLWRSDNLGRDWTNLSVKLPSASLQGFAAGSDKSRDLVLLYCSIPSENRNGEFSGALYRSVDRGETWESAMGSGLNQDLKKADQWGHAAVAQYLQLLTTDRRPETVYAFNTSTGFHPPHHETVYRSDDAGASWRATYFQDPRFREFNVESDYVMASTGQSFKGGGTPYGVAICNSAPDRVMLVITEAHITHNGGESWINGSTYRAPGSAAQPGAQWICNGQVVTTTWNYYIDPFQPARHYIAYTDIGFARSLDAGKSWIWWDKKSWAPWRNTCYELAFDPEVPGLIWGAFSNVHDIPNDNIISERHGSRGPGGICISRDFGASWKSETEGLPLQAATSVVIDPNSPKEARVLYAGVFDAGLFKSVDSGKTWKPKNAGLGHSANMRVSKVFLHPDGNLYAVVCGKRPARGEPLMSEGVGLYRSVDAAENWEKINRADWRYIKDFSIDPHNSKRILLGVCDSGGGDESGGLYATNDGGESWRRIGRKGRQTFGGYFHPKQKDWIYMTLTEGAPGPGLWFSPDTGQSWTPFAELPFSNIQRITFDGSNEEVIYVTTFGGSVWKGPATPGEIR